VIVSSGAPTLAALQQATRTIPVVFGQVVDPVAAGFVDSLSHPGGNITGFSSFEYSMGGKWLGTLKEIVPSIVRVAVLRDPGSGVGAIGMLGAIQAVMPSFALPLSLASGRDGAEFERVIEAFANEPNGGLIVLPAPNTIRYRQAIIGSAAKHRVPTIYPYRFFVKDGGLISYGIVPSDMFRRAAAYVDAIFKGAKPSDLPVQQPTKFEMTINLGTARSLAIAVPPTLLARADEVIE
jgi:putative ABC transport system substrate-binding protein